MTALILIVVAVRVALPYVLRPVLEDQISALLNGRIEVDDVDLALLKGEAVVEGVRIYEGESEGVASFAKLLANVRWTALPFQQAVVEEIHLLSPKIRVVREADGEINLVRLPAPSEPSADPDPVEAEVAEEEGGGWPAGLTRLALEDATITFTDRTVENFEDVEFDIELLQVERVAYGGPIYDGDGKVTLVAEVAGAPLKIEADFASEVLNATSAGNLHLRDLNVGLGSPYAAQLLGWSDLRGLLDIDVDFAAESGDAESPRMALALRDFLIAVEGESEPALKWDALEIAIQMADPEERFVRVSEVRLTNPVVRVRPADEQPLVLLSRMEGTATDAEEAAAAESDAGAEVDGAAPAVEAPAAEVAPSADPPTEVPGAPPPAVEDDAAAADPADEAGEVEAPAPAAAAAADVAAPQAELEAGAAEVPEAPEAVAVEAGPVEAPAQDGSEAAAKDEVVDAAAPGEAVAAADGAAPAAGAGGVGTEAPVAGEDAPRWELDKLVVEGARVLVEAPEKTLDVGLQVEVNGLSSEPGDKAELVIEAAIEGGTLQVGGDVGLAPVSFDGGIDLADFSIPAVLAVVPEPRAKILRAGVLRSDLDVSVLVGEGDTPAVDATVSGKVGLAGLEVSDEDAKRFSFKWKDLDIAIDGIDVRNGAPAADGGAAPIRIASIVLDEPAFRGVRQEDGSIALPAELSGGSDDSSAETAAPAGDEAVEVSATGEAGGAGDTSAAGEAESMPAVEVAKVRINDGSARILDKAVQPEAKPGLKSFDLALDGIRMPERRIDNLKFKGIGVRGGVLAATGKIAGEATDVLVTIEKYRLVPYDPYAVTFSGYGIRRGMLSVESKIRLEGDDFDTHTNVIVHQLGLKNTSGTTGFEDQIGVPVSLALALLKDAEGNITLDVPVSGNREQTNVGIGGIIAQQLKRILVNALTSPLKLFGAVGGGDEVGDFSAARIAFAKGDRTLSAEGREQAEEVAKLLRERPELAIHLDVRNSLGDVRSLQEAVLLEELRQRESPGPYLTEIRAYLEARSAGEEAELPYHLEPILEEMLSHRKPPAEQVDALSKSRVDVVREVMTTELQVRPEQILVEEQLSDGFIDGPAVVEAELGVLEEDEEEIADDEDVVG